LPANKTAIAAPSARESNSSSPSARSQQHIAVVLSEKMPRLDHDPFFIQLDNFYKKAYVSGTGSVLVTFKQGWCSFSRRPICFSLVVAARP
jgi:hypothetical protein